MSQQTTLTSYFGKRKRIINDEAILASKKILLDQPKLTPLTKNENDIIQQKNNCIVHVAIKSTVENDECSPDAKSFDGNKSSVVCDDQNTGVDKTVHVVGPEKISQEKQELTSISSTSAVTFKWLGSLSPVKKTVHKNTQGGTEKKVEVHNNVDKLLKTPEKQIIPIHPGVAASLERNTCNNPSTTDDVLKSAKELITKIKQTQKRVSSEIPRKGRKELSLKEVKDKLKHSGKLNELKKSISKINEQAAVLIELENKKKENSVPKLSKFKAIEVDVPPSPQKNALYSPSKVDRSPAKPAYERFNFLAEAGPTLPLPFAFQKLYELFRAVDTISSMMINRGEDITFNKLKPAVQEMTRKTFTLRHLGQMAAVLPNAFSFQQEKVRNFGATSKVDRYELVITPTFQDGSQNKSTAAGGGKDGGIFHANDRMSMTPRIIKARREAFHNALLDKTKDCHEEFLNSLDPPMHINRNDLKRWHPNFMVDHVPDITPTELPQPPNSDRPATAKEVLERAKDFLSSNARLQKALESASQPVDESRDITSAVSPVIKDKVDSRLCNPLKGISKSLLERVRARQAAKALDSMRMTPQQEKETVMYARLPSIARIVRTLFVNEQRGVLSWEITLEKVQFSCNRSLSKGEVESHIKLLIELLPEWLSVVHIRNGNYLKMNPAADLTSAMNKLDKLVAEKSKHS